MSKFSFFFFGLSKNMKNTKIKKSELPCSAISNCFFLNLRQKNKYLKKCVIHVLFSGPALNMFFKNNISLKKTNELFRIIIIKLNENDVFLIIQNMIINIVIYLYFIQIISLLRLKKSNKAKTR
ncbi:hypothetical protein RFI_39753 [Reticulomyxa filosa]|uniref:Uncharacterized protein n=1 Tax=Reticulomyxa filosa TaxID=46433 RepID=X6L8J8_RETFI|nr:hypothetical protein RFI_39753 [Reticulomyxa filosa]|eukprot:ETN97773.1 hypothetical protein RFI_39753 [Reticulomyxa filosa]